MRYPVLRPPYVYRWAALLSTLVVAISLLVSMFSPGLDQSPAAAQVAARQDVPAAASTPAEVSAPPADPSLIHTTARTGRYVALTFDDGPDPAYTPRILDVLARNGAVATFCMVGMQVTRHPELVRAVLGRGMRVCDHTVSHDEELSTRTEQRMTAEIQGCWADLQVAADKDVPVDYFRAPAGRWSPPMRAIASRAGMKALSWTVDTRDWAMPGAARIVASAQHDIRPGALVLLHDGGGDRTQTVDALEILLPWLKSQGYEFDFPA
ncbi:polysaccharide deacetylase family protein [Amycolatopsis sp. K13G38]|uniref:Polysaccharide deacetylase family protein n=1 Tax=Amycolatopsis acididurans TaxID=2724524 RepID=A0ABX1J1P5_9PSEU|nr:polysaccharide deacetylase family protein [Amycolatopsis acididurans]NKQ53564.1 polysaccharide deacetylase family protein [Amycolatopsis acididurans]